MVTMLHPSTLSTPIPLLADAVPPGYCCVPAEGVAGHSVDDDARARAACRWLPPEGAPASAPLAVDVAVTAFGRRTAALRAVTSAPDIPEGMAVRPLFPPRIGEETAAIRADVTEGDTRYVLYRVDVQLDRCVATVAAAWRWPAGSPAWVYERARRLADDLGAGRWTLPDDAD